MAEGNGNGNGSPLWLKAADKFGVPSIIAVGLVYWLTQYIAPDVKQNGLAIMNNERAVQKLESMVTAHIDATGRANAELLFYQRQQCMILARLAKLNAEGSCNPHAEYGQLYSREIPEERKSGQPAGRIFDR